MLRSRFAKPAQLSEPEGIMYSVPVKEDPPKVPEKVN